MSDAEKRMREAFSAIEVPPEVAARTLASIEERRPRAAAPARRRGFARRFGWAAAAVLAACAIGFGGYAYAAAPTAYVDISANPSLELGINRFDVVVAARALNDDGGEVLSRVDVRGRPYGEALDVLAEALEEYRGEGAELSIDVKGADDAQCAALRDASEKCFGHWREKHISCSHGEGAAHSCGEGADGPRGQGKRHGYRGGSSPEGGFE